MSKKDWTPADRVLNAAFKLVKDTENRKAGKYKVTRRSTTVFLSDYLALRRALRAALKKSGTKKFEIPRKKPERWR